MLVLSRRPEQSVSINNGQIRVMVLSVRGDVVRLGFEAAEEIPIHRSEVQVLVDREREDGGLA